MIALGICAVMVGLGLFIEGVKQGLMSFAENIGFPDVRPFEPADHPRRRCPARHPRHLRRSGHRRACGDPSHRTAPARPGNRESPATG
ncbi:MAG: hypothetical protein IPN75_00025 [Dechloromonas sp.]|uniref:Uncharacterized protein n=1 Tax=Candidatus Dechloromonas phosphorivorans TaxID=2899244 RepID=A0A9D7QLG0_9RHOO|nr:hypothetical protein [Candidatus Dechloromonas phosphorivorans]